MKRALNVFSCLLLSLAAASAYGAQPPGIKWHTDFDTAVQEAMKKKVPLVQFVYEKDAQGKTPVCRKVEEGPLASPELAKYRDQAVFVKTDRAESDDPDLLPSPPAVIVMHCRSAGSFVSYGDIEGVKDTPEFMKQFNSNFAYITRLIAK